MNIKAYFTCLLLLSVGFPTCLSAKSRIDVTGTYIVNPQLAGDGIPAGTLIINEIQSKNVDMFIDPSFNFGGWIELYNPTNEDIDLGGCYVSDDPDMFSGSASLFLGEDLRGQGKKIDIENY